MLACACDQDGRTVEYLIKHKADAFVVDNKGYNALHYAAASGNPYHALMVIFDHMMNDVSPSPTVTKAMHLAASHGHEEALAVLLSKVNNPNAYDTNGYTALHLAAQNGHEKIVGTLVKKGAHVSLHDKTGDRQTALHLAAANGHESVLRVLWENTEDHEVLNARDAHGQTPLMLAVAKGHYDTVELLIVYGSHLDAVDTLKRSALFRGAAFGQEACVQLLLEQGVSATKRDKVGRTAFHIAAMSGQVGVLRKLLDVLENTVSVHDLVDKDGLTPLHWAAYKGHESCVDVLMSMLDNFVIKGTQFSPLHCAVAEDRDQCLSLYLSQFKENLVNLRDHNMRTLLHIAAFQNATACFQLLLNEGASINLKDKHGRTPLMMASYNGNLRIVGEPFLLTISHLSLKVVFIFFFFLSETLIERKCDLDLTDSNGDTALHLACKKEHEAIASYILKSIPDKSICISYQNKKGQR